MIAFIYGLAGKSRVTGPAPVEFQLIVIVIILTPRIVHYLTNGLNDFYGSRLLHRFSVSRVPTCLNRRHLYN